VIVLQPVLEVHTPDGFALWPIRGAGGPVFAPTIFTIGSPVAAAGWRNGAGGLRVLAGGRADFGHDPSPFAELLGVPSVAAAAGALDLPPDQD
jgi:hypothetical protein